MRTKQEIAEAALTVAGHITQNAGPLASLVRTLAELVHDLALSDEQPKPVGSEATDDLWPAITSLAARSGFQVSRMRSRGRDVVAASRTGQHLFVGTAGEAHAYLTGWERCAHNEGR